MSQISSTYARLPGMGTLVEEYEAAYTWGPYPRFFQGANINASAADSGNSQSSTLRIGLVMGLQLSTQTWLQYNPAATDGTEVASGVLPFTIRMQDVLLQTNQGRFYAMLVGGGVQASKLIGLDALARSQMAGNFWFDDDLPGRHQFPFRRFQTKTANYQIVAADNLSHFDNLGAAGEVDFTLPPIANGYWFGFHAIAGQTIKVISSEGTNIVAFNNASANSVAFSTGGQIIGGGVNVYTNGAGTKWIVDNASAGSNTVTVA